MPSRAKTAVKPIARQVNMLEAKTQLSRIIAAIADGDMDEVIIARDGEPAARIVPLEKKKGGIILGLAAGKYPPLSVEDFDAYSDEMAELFVGGPLEPAA
jgi:antitoxin (DNA-binding transcriptional repressor) of toxin-antitoxin stability system